jgi:hypothetical protein
MDLMGEENRISEPDEMEKLVAESDKAAFYSGKLASARFFISTVLNLATAKAQAIKNADKAALEIAEDAF